jgi:ribosomal protein S6
MQTEKLEEKGDVGTVYEVSYLLLPSLANEQVPAKATALKDMLTSAGGAIISDENPVLIDLAYQMTKVVGTTRHKVDSGYFGWAKFEMVKDENSKGIEVVKKALDANPEIVRYLIIKTVRENTLLEGKMKLRKEEKMRKDEELENVGGELVKNPEEIDKSIDELVIA